MILLYAGVRLGERRDLVEDTRELDYVALAVLVIGARWLARQWKRRNASV